MRPGTPRPGSPVNRNSVLPVQSNAAARRPSIETTPRSVIVPCPLPLVSGIPVKPMSKGRVSPTVQRPKNCADCVKGWASRRSVESSRCWSKLSRAGLSTRTASGTQARESRSVAGITDAVLREPEIEMLRSHVRDLDGAGQRDVLLLVLVRHGTRQRSRSLDVGRHEIDETHSRPGLPGEIDGLHPRHDGKARIRHRSGRAPREENQRGGGQPRARRTAAPAHASPHQSSFGLTPSCW